MAHQTFPPCQSTTPLTCILCRAMMPLNSVDKYREHIQEWHNVTVVEELERAVMVAEERREEEESKAEKIPNNLTEGEEAGEIEDTKRRMTVKDGKVIKKRKVEAMEVKEGGVLHIKELAGDELNPDDTEDDNENYVKNCSDQEEEEENREGIKRHNCKVEDCPRSFTTTNSLSNHMRSDHGAPKLECKEPGCSQSFNSRNSVNEHGRKYHNIQKLKCKEPECGKTFNSPSVRIYHMRRYHGAPKPKCTAPGCQFTAIHPEQLSNHMRRDHGAPKLQCQATNCQVFFIARNARDKHMQKEHSG